MQTDIELTFQCEDTFLMNFLYCLFPVDEKNACRELRYNYSGLSAFV